MLKRILSQALLVTVVMVLTTIFQPLRFFETFAQPGCQTFKETGKTVCGKFLTYWNTHGGLAQQGFPLSGEFSEVSDLNGKPYKVQYFERAVFELHPENPAPHDVLLSQLGRLQFNRKYPGGDPSNAQLSPTDLKYQLFEVFGKDLVYCDPDYWPLVRDEGTSAQAWYDSVDKASEEYQSILKHNNISATPKMTPEQLLFAYREHKRLNAVTLEKASDTTYKFVITVGGDADKPGQEGPGIRIEGTIDVNGKTTVASKTNVKVNCPICLAANTLIDTPDGPIKVQEMKQGMAVWTTDKSGARVAGVVLKTAQRAVTASHQVVHLVLSDGRKLYVSPGHPLVGGRAIGTLHAGDSVDGATVVSAQWLPYKDAYTYDILSSGDTGAYWANGILLGSTIRK
ncbi:MAG TPA: Hint domain-containing protein [Chloroflexia bacterium]|nr:Hint domain-containing protein [Chloroflexia bacterium]